MIKLLRAGTRRYLHSYVFWLALVATAIMSFVSACQARQSSFDDMYAVMSFVISAVLIVLLVGREYSDGGFRNKVINGHTKGNIFISELILGIGAVFVLGLVFFAIFFAVISYIFTAFPIDLIVKMFIDCVLVHLCFAAILVTICCWIPGRTIVAIVNVLLVFVMIFGTTRIQEELSHQEFFEEYDTISEQRVDEDGKVHYFEHKVEGSERLRKNPMYVGGFKRTVYEAIENLSPYGHISWYIEFTYSWFDYKSILSWEGNGVQHTQTWEDVAKQIIANDIDDEDYKKVNDNLIYSCALLIGVCVIGYLGFRKKELK